MSSWGTSSLITNSLGKLTVAGVAGEFVTGSGSTTDVAFEVVEAEDAGETTKLGSDSTPRRARMSSHGLSSKKLGKPDFSLSPWVNSTSSGLEKVNLLFKDLLELANLIGSSDIHRGHSTIIWQSLLGLALRKASGRAVMSRWELTSAVWSLTELSSIASEALIALIQLKLVEERVFEDRRHLLIQKIKRANEIIDTLIEEIKGLSSLFGENMPVNKVASPVLREFLNEYGIAYARDAINRLNDLKSTLNRILEGQFTSFDVEKIRRFLEAISRATITQIEKLRYIGSCGSPWET